MANICMRCGKGPRTQSKRKLLRGHYNPTSKKMKYPNLQWIRIRPELRARWKIPAGRRVRLCAKCIKIIGSH